MSVTIQPATIAQVSMTDRGTVVTIDDDVAGIAAQIREIDEHLVLRYAPQEEYFVVEHHQAMPDGSMHEQLVLTSTVCGQHIVDRLREISSPSYDYAAEIERVEDEAKEAEEERFSERRRDVLERLAHAIRKDTGARKNF